MTKQPEHIWFNGKLILWHEAKVHVLSHALHYGSSVFEGIRTYNTEKGPVFFRLEDHIKRFYDSAKIYRMPLPYSFEEMLEACRQTVAQNHLKSAYIRPIAFYGHGGLGLLPKPDHPVDIAIAAFEWGAYLGEESLEQGVDVGVSSWNRAAPNTIPTAAKAGGNYLSSQLVAEEAQRHGYAEGIALDTQGYVSEGSGENIFVIRDNTFFTPPETAAILPGLTRNSVCQLAKRQGYKVVETSIAREALYLADEIFMTGTAAEIVPVRSVDGRRIGFGKRGEITKKMQNAFFGLFDFTTEDQQNWLTPVYPDNFASQVA
ncbi:MAG: branched-chain-amino-acid transaminase [Pseudomonadota bacterium]